MIIKLKNSSGFLTDVKIGFSWTTLFFGYFVPLFRGDIKWFLVSILLSILTWGISWFIIPFFYNSVYIKSLLASGFVPADQMSRDVLIEHGYFSKETNFS